MTRMRNYRSPDPGLWQGRKSSQSQGPQYWHEAVTLINLDTRSLKELKDDTPDIALVGYACDEGVRRNLGRPGAKEGPLAIRRRLAKLAYHHTECQVADLGDIVCAELAMEEAQEDLSTLVAHLLQTGVFPLVLGGGHDVAYGHYRGISRFIGDQPKRRIGIINFDAHFDLRPVENQSHSGTPFYQILTESQEVGYFALGIQKASNAPLLFEMAQETQTKYILSEDCDIADFELITSKLNSFIESHDWLYITIDLDGFSSAYAPGVSAPSPMGFTPSFVEKTLTYLFNSGKVLSCDIAELNPIFDVDDHTATLAARLVEIITTLHKQTHID